MIKELIAKLEGPARRRFVRLHGEGAPHQADLYRCNTCGGLITWKKITSADLCCQGHVVASNPTWLETIRLMVFPRSI